LGSAPITEEAIATPPSAETKLVPVGYGIKK
uniref:Elongation factor 1-delta (Fragments) n=1 Tax=Populus euphratica TaxID=75702 RepID=EF1D_POPEU|nr:RecName: Full=Elongation factor 1-delta; Short=EF-1-delta; AltName: Full=Elongation factor 1B-beta; AltName: Full=eEF-1B beta [Populus euphratica]